MPCSASTPATFLVPLLLLVGVSGCGQDDDAVVSDRDAYTVGCPAVDAAVGSGRVARRVATQTVEKIRDHGDLSVEAKKWADSAVRVLSTPNPHTLPETVTGPVVDGCREHGHALSNLP